MADIAETVREGLRLFFGYIGGEYGHAPTHLDMTLRLSDGARVRAHRRPLDEGGTPDIIVEVESEA